MLPAPRTIATSTPRSCTCLTCAATARSRSGSVPNSSEPMRDSPESFRSIRRKTGCGTRPGSLLADGEARESSYDDVLTGLARQVGAELLDRAAVVLLAVDVLLVEQHDLLEPLAQLALGDLAPHVLGLVGGLLLEHAQLGVLGLLGHVVLGDPLRGRRGRDVQRDVLGEGDEVLVARDEVGVAVDLDEHADLAVGMDVGLDGPLAGLAARELAELVAHLDPEDLDGLVHVAAGLFQCPFAVHHARAG